MTVHTLAQPFLMVVAQTLAIEPPPLRALVWRALLSQRKGRRGGPLLCHTLVRQEVPLEAEYIVQYAAVYGFSLVHGVSTTYPHPLDSSLQLMLMTESASPYPVIGLVYPCNTTRQHQRLQASERMRVEVCPCRLSHHARGQASAIETAIVKAGAVVWESLSTYLRVGVLPSQGTPSIVLSSVQNLSLDGRWDVIADTGRRYVDVSGD